MSNEIWCCHVNKQADANATCSPHTYKVCYVCVCVCIHSQGWQRTDVVATVAVAVVAVVVVSAYRKWRKWNKSRLIKPQKEQGKPQHGSCHGNRAYACEWVCVCVLYMCVVWVFVSCVWVRLGYVSVRQSKVDSCCQLNHRQPPHTLPPKPYLLTLTYTLAHPHTHTHTYSLTLDYLCIDKYLSTRQVELNF